ncbi:unnamed protein product [marine sediment metagenome]|uniref:Uncharacterized protein n=1 Tax=marine sediment metagenome TaxID=412755 RepID=X1KXX3_9ZZZZ
MRRIKRYLREVGEEIERDRRGFERRFYGPGGPEKLGCRATLQKSLVLVIIGLVLFAIGGTIHHFAPPAYDFIAVFPALFGAIAWLGALIFLIDRR